MTRITAGITLFMIPAPILVIGNRYSKITDRIQSGAEQGEEPAHRGHRCKEAGGSGRLDHCLTGCGTGCALTSALQPGGEHMHGVRYANDQDYGGDHAVYDRDGLAHPSHQPQRGRNGNADRNHADGYRFVGAEHPEKKNH